MRDTPTEPNGAGAPKRHRDDQQGVLCDALATAYSTFGMVHLPRGQWDAIPFVNKKVFGCARSTIEENRTFIAGVRFSVYSPTRVTISHDEASVPRLSALVSLDPNHDCDAIEAGVSAFESALMSLGPSVEELVLSSALAPFPIPRGAVPSGVKKVSFFRDARGRGADHTRRIKRALSGMGARPTTHFPRGVTDMSVSLSHGAYALVLPEHLASLEIVWDGVTARQAKRVERFAFAAECCLSLRTLRFTGFTPRADLSASFATVTEVVIDISAEDPPIPSGKFLPPRLAERMIVICRSERSGVTWATALPRWSFLSVEAVPRSGTFRVTMLRLAPRPPPPPSPPGEWSDVPAASITLAIVFQTLLPGRVGIKTLASAMMASKDSYDRLLPMAEAHGVSVNPSSENRAMPTKALVSVRGAKTGSVWDILTRLRSFERSIMQLPESVKVLYLPMLMLPFPIRGGLVGPSVRKVVAYGRRDFRFEGAASAYGAKPATVNKLNRVWFEDMRTCFVGTGVTEMSISLTCGLFVTELPESLVRLEIVALRKVVQDDDTERVQALEIAAGAVRCTSLISLKLTGFVPRVSLRGSFERVTHLEIHDTSFFPSANCQFRAPSAVRHVLISGPQLSGVDWNWVTYFNDHGCQFSAERADSSACDTLTFDM